MLVHRGGGQIRRPGECRTPWAGRLFQAYRTAVNPKMMDAGLDLSPSSRSRPVSHTATPGPPLVFPRPRQVIDSYGTIWLARK